MRHSYSALQVLAQCERKYALRYLEGYEADRPDRPAPLRGSAWHGVMQAHRLAVGAGKRTLLVRPEKIQLFRGTELGINWDNEFEPMIMSPDYGPEEPLNGAAMIAQYESWWTHQETDYTEEMAAEFGAPLPERLRDLLARYLIHYDADRDRYEPLITEYEWQRQAPNGKLLQGRVDGVERDLELGLIVVRDYKSHESWPSEPENVQDLMDSQLHLQAWGMAPILRELGAGVPQAVQFDRVRFKKPTEPKLTTKGELSKSITDFDTYTYTNWCTANSVEVDPVLVAKCDAKTDAWFRRSQKPLSMRAVEAHVKAAQQQVVRSEGLDAATAMLVPSKSCSYCEFLSLCRAEIIGGRPTDFVPQDYGLRKIK